MATDRRSLAALAVLSIAACAGDSAEDPGPAESVAPGSAAGWRFRGGWIAPREGYPLDSEGASAALAGMRGLGVNTVAVGWDVQMPALTEPKLVWGARDPELRAVLRRIRDAGLKSFLMPRIESPAFFAPPFPFRADIGFASAAEWEAFHAELERMVLHYARLAAEEDVALYSLGLELKRSSVHHEERWRAMIGKVRSAYPGPITYSANWYEEWNRVPFWDALDFIGIGAYFELRPRPGESGAAPVAELEARWAPIRAELVAFARSHDRPLLFTEVGYPGYADCAERPWEWAGKGGAGAPVDHRRQAQAFAALLSVFGPVPEMAGGFLWTFHTTTRWVGAGEYGIAGRPAAGVVGRAFGGKGP